MDSPTQSPFSGRNSPPALPPLLLKHSSQKCRRKNKMEFGLCCLPGSYLISCHELCLNLSNKNTTTAGIFFCFVILIIFIGDFVPQRRRGSAESPVATSSLQVGPCFFAQR